MMAARAAMTDARIRLLVVDDSAVVRQAVALAVARANDIELVATAADPLFAMEKMRRGWPDVIILDIEMPRMDGLSFLRALMAERPTPVIICSSLVTTGSETLAQALAAGTFSVIGKPKLGVKAFIEDSSDDLVAAVRAAARANVGALRGGATATAARGAAVGALAAGQTLHRADVILPAATTPMLQTTDRVIAIGTSTGGTQALEAILTSLPKTVPGIVVVQHMPQRFTAMFAERLDSLAAIEVREARSNDRVLPGRALIAPGGHHMLLRRNGAQYHVEVVDGPPVNRHRPSVDVLFRSVARFAGRNAIGVIMTGMGDDGARGLREMRDAGAATIAQDEASCVVFGMPREAIRLGGVEQVLSLSQIAPALVAAGR
jgi:two-component system chemotaxis response regulator CheB